jgi:hypothetical protein
MADTNPYLGIATPVKTDAVKPIAAFNEQSGATSKEISFIHANQKVIIIAGSVLIAGLLLVSIKEFKILAK